MGAAVDCRAGRQAGQVDRERQQQGAILVRGSLQVQRGCGVVLQGDVSIDTHVGQDASAVVGDYRDPVHEYREQGGL